jgi:hypothetical protein
MEALSHPSPPRQQPLRAIIEIRGGELRVYPLCQTDEDEKNILDALRFVIEDHQR